MSLKIATDNPAVFIVCTDAEEARAARTRMIELDYDVLGGVGVHVEERDARQQIRELVACRFIVLPSDWWGHATAVLLVQIAGFLDIKMLDVTGVSITTTSVKSMVRR